MKLLFTLLTFGMSPAAALRLYLMLGLSLGAHLAAAFVLFLLPSLDHYQARDALAIEVIDNAPPPPEPEPVVEEPEPPPPEPPPPEPEPVVQRRPRPTPTPSPSPEPPPAEEPPSEAPAAEEAVADFSGMTLTNEDAPAEFATAIGNGEPSDGPLGQPGAQVTGRHRAGQQGGVPGGTGTDPGPHIAAASDLSRQPGPPADRLIRLLERNYPSEARDSGVEGHADVRIHVHADGRVQPLGVLRETYAGFGQACRRTIRQGGHWTPPLDRQGNAVDTITVFRCTFTITF